MALAPKLASQLADSGNVDLTGNLGSCPTIIHVCQQADLASRAQGYLWTCRSRLVGSNYPSGTLCRGSAPQCGTTEPSSAVHRVRAVEWVLVKQTFNLL